MSGEKGVSAFPEGENLFKWIATIHGPPGTVNFHILILFDSTFTFSLSGFVTVNKLITASFLSHVFLYWLPRAAIWIWLLFYQIIVSAFKRRCFRWTLLLLNYLYLLTHCKHHSLTAACYSIYLTFCLYDHYSYNCL